MFIHEKTIMTQIRVYDNPDGYENKEPYTGILTIHYLGDKKVYIEGFRGENTSPRALVFLREYFRSKDIETISYHRGEEERNVSISEIS